MKKITIGITIYNRRKTLERMISSLFASNLKHDGVEWTVRVYDDCSNEYDESDVRSMFPTDIDYYRHDRNHGSDYNIGFMYRSFLETGDDILFNCDSDLVFDKGWIAAMLNFLSKTDGVLSLFNTKAHEICKIEGDLCTKKDIGSAGTAMTREAVETICNNISERESNSSLDYNWCALYGKMGKKIYCTNRSYVQHIGIDGFNSSGGRFDIGDGFVVDDSVNGQILGDILYEMVTKNNEARSDIRTFYYLFPFDSIPSGKKLVIYGAGVVGQDYRKQLEASGYCSKLTQVDKNYIKYSDVSSPGILKDIDCDYVIIAANLINVRDEMKAAVLQINPGLKDKLIECPCRIIRL